jgi:hypothetical protein
MVAAFKVHGFREMQAMLVGLARKQGGAPHAIEDGRDFHQHVTGIGERLLTVIGELSPQMADQV